MWPGTGSQLPESNLIRNKFPLSVNDPSFRGRKLVSNNAIIGADGSGIFSLNVSDATHVVVDINGYFSDTAGLLFYPLPPCRIVDTRSSQGFPVGYGSPNLSQGDRRTFEVSKATHCGSIPVATAYYLNLSVGPYPSPSEPR
jgi:hypothetical protein